MADGKSLAVARLHQELQETSTEADARKAGNFGAVEEKLPQRWSSDEVELIDKATAFLGRSNPFSKTANPKDNKVWLLDNTAYRPTHDSPHDSPHDSQPWQAEFVSCFFNTGRKEVGEFVASIAEQIGLDDKSGADHAARKRIEERVQPFIDAIAPARSVDVSVPCANDQPHMYTLGPSNANGISSQIISVGQGDTADGTVVKTTSVDDLFPDLYAETCFAGPNGWAIISDIDDTIKVTHTTDPIGTLKTTFAEIPETTPGLQEFYEVLDVQFHSPAWFYLSASPYNLYPFIHSFIHDHYKPGTIILRDSSWMVLGGLLKSLTQGTQAYKTDRMNKIHGWLPNRKFICVGDSTQSDPEAYAEMYQKYPGWIKAIYIRVVEGEPHMANKNKPERFENAFQGVPSHIWKLFTNPQKDLGGHLKNVATEAHVAINSSLQDYFSRYEKSVKADVHTNSSNANSGGPSPPPQN